MIVRELIAKIGFRLDKSSERQVKLSFKQFQGGIQNLDKSINKTGGMLGKLFAGAAIAGLGRKLVGTINTFQQLRGQLATLEGSTEKANIEFDKLRVFAKEAPFELSNIVKSFATLRGAGIKPTTDEMAVLGDMAAGMGSDITDVSEAFAKASIGNFELLRDRLKIAVTQANGQVTLAFGDFKKTVKKDSKEVQKALLELGRLKFKGGMERQLQTLGGQWTLLQDNLADFAEQIGAAGLTAGLRSLSDFFKDLTKKAGDQGLAKVLGKNLAKAIELLVKGLKFLEKNATRIKAALEILIMINVAKWLIGIAAAISAVDKATWVLRAKFMAVIALLLFLEDLVAFFQGRGSLLGQLIGDSDKPFNTFAGFVGRLAKLLVTFVDVVSDAMVFLMTVVTDAFYHLLNIGSETLVVLWDGITWFINNLSEGFGIILRAFSNFFSRLRNVIMKMPMGPEMLQLGSKMVGAAGDAAGGVADFVTGGATPSVIELGGRRQMAVATTVSAPITINPSAGMDEEQIGRVAARHIQAQQSDATRREMRAQFRNAAEDRRGGVT